MIRYKRKKTSLKRHLEDSEENWLAKAQHSCVSRAVSKESGWSVDSGFSDLEQSVSRVSVVSLGSSISEQVVEEEDEPSLVPDECPWRTDGFDLFLRIGGSLLPVHRSRISAESDIIKTIIYSVNYSDEQAPIISLPNRESRFFKELIKFIYDKSYRMTDENVVGLLNVADEFMVENVLARCERHLLETDCFTALELLELAVKYNLEKLRQEASLRVSMIPGIEYSNEFETMGVEEQNLVLRHLVQRQRRKLDLLEDIAAKRCPYHQFSSSCSKCCFKVVY